jgi:hypothetical protein
MRDQPYVVTWEVLDGLTVDSQPWLSCDECFDRMDFYVEQLIADPGYRDRVMETHLVACPACAEEVASLRDLVAGEV